MPAAPVAGVLPGFSRIYGGVGHQTGNAATARCRRVGGEMGSREWGGEVRGRKIGALAHGRGCVRGRKLDILIDGGQW